MKRNELILLKANLLCRGLRASPAAKAALLRDYPHFFDKGFIDAANLNILGSNLCVSTNEKFTLNSPYTLFYRGGLYFIEAFGKEVIVNFFGNLPKTGTILDNIARLHAEKTINIWPSTSCCFDLPSQKCAFCSLERKDIKPIDADYLAESIEKLLKKTPGFTLNFSGGTYFSPDNMARYWISLVTKIRAFSDTPIAIELAPPSDLSLIDDLKNAGLNAIIMNLEIADESLRAKVCPGKSAITRPQYYKAFERAVELFGWGQVSSVLIAGIQPKEDIIRECEIMAKLGVFPTIMPFRPVDTCGLAESPACSPEDLIYMSEILGGLLREYDLAPRRQEGCTKCGGCSIENDCFETKEVINF
ncbi:MAG: radical SAM protein [Eubacteriales bacterium]